MNDAYIAHLNEMPVEKMLKALEGESMNVIIEDGKITGLEENKKMKLIKAKFIKDGEPKGRAYTYKVAEDIQNGDYLQDAKHSKLIMIDDEVDMAFVEQYGIDNLKTLERFVEEETEEEIEI